MGREEQAKAERAELRRAVVDEALGRVSELEEKIAAHKKTINQQARALEAIANALTAYAGEVVKIQASLARPRGWRRVVAYFRATVQHARQQPAPVESRKITIRKVDEVNAGAVEAAEIERAALAAKPSHLHQYERDGPFMYRCSVAGCDRRATLDEIAAESEYLRRLDADAARH